MKLRNKNTGEIMDDAQYRNYSVSDGFGFRMNGKEWEYHSLAEFNEEWEDAPEEEWRDVLGFEELYQVSNLGNVRTVKRGEATAMSQEEHWNGYLSVHLRNKGVERRASVHRLVAEAFIPNPDGLRDVNHKNGIKTDNRVENLEWLSHSDNIKHAYQMREPTKPLIEDDAKRSVFKAWAEILGRDLEKADFKYDAERNGFDCYLAESIIEFANGEGINCVDREIYTFRALCGEEER